MESQNEEIEKIEKELQEFEDEKEEILYYDKENEFLSDIKDIDGKINGHKRQIKIYDITSDDD